MSLEELKDVTLAKVLDDLSRRLDSIISYKIGYIVSKIGVDTISRDHILFTPIRNLIAQLSSFITSDEDIIHVITDSVVFAKRFAELGVDKYNLEIVRLYRRLSNIFDDNRLRTLVMAIYNMLLLFVTPDERNLEKVFGESLYYWAKVGAKFGYISNQGYDKFINNFHDFTALIQAIERETGISFDLDMFIHEAYRKLFVDTLIDVYNSYSILVDDSELLTLMEGVADFDLLTDVYSKKKYEISAGWTIYDPVKRDFVFKPQCEAPIREWIYKYDPSSYWLAICITNNSNQPINSFEAEFEVSSLLEVRKAYIEGLERTVPVYRERGSKIGYVKYIIVVPEELGINIPRMGSKRIYVNIHSKVCGQRYMIENGRIKTGNSEVKLNDLDFWYSCELLNIYEQPEYANTPEGKKLIEQRISIKLSNLDENSIREVIRCYNNMLELIDEGVKTAMKYINNIIILRKLVGETEFYKWLYNNLKIVFERKVSKNLDQLMKMPDYEVQLSDDILTEMRKILIDAIKHL